MANTNVRTNEATATTEEKFLKWEQLQKYNTKIQTKMATDDATTLQSAKDYADNLAGDYDAAGTAQTKVDELANGAVKANTDAITKLNGDETVEGSVDKKIKDASDTLEQKITDSTYDDTAIQAKVSANETAIGVLNGTGEGSVAKKVSDEIAKVVAGADESMDTLKEVSDWISNHADSAAAMQTKINANENAINTLNGEGEGSVKKTAADAVAEYAAGADTSLEVLEQMSAWLKEHPADAAAMKVQINANKEAIGILNGSATVEGSVLKTVTDEIAKIVSDPDVSLDALMELSAWIAAHPNDASAMNLQINTNKDDIAKLKELVAQLPEDSDATNLIDYITKAINTAKEGLTADIATAKTEAVTESGTNTDTKIAAKVGEIGDVTVKEYVDTAKTDAATDATTKANQALTDAKAYTDVLAERVSTLESAEIGEITDEDIESLFASLDAGV